MSLLRTVSLDVLDAYRYPMCMLWRLPAHANSCVNMAWSNAYP